MKSLNILKLTAMAALGGLGVLMAIGNPSQSDYEEYALHQLTDYLKNKVCTESPKTFDNLLQRQCTLLVDTGRPRLKRIIAETTNRQNFLFFSIYKTDLSLNRFLPGYHFETIGVFRNFYIYQAERQ